jgi:hypothetical protein
MWDVMSTTLGQ